MKFSSLSAKLRILYLKKNDYNFDLANSWRNFSVSLNCWNCCAACRQKCLKVVSFKNLQHVETIPSWFHVSLGDYICNMKMGVGMQLSHKSRFFFFFLVFLCVIERRQLLTVTLHSSILSRLKPSIIKITGWIMSNSKYNLSSGFYLGWHFFWIKTRFS